MEIRVVLTDAQGKRTCENWTQRRWNIYARNAIEDQHIITIAHGGTVRAMRADASTVGTIYCPYCLTRLDTVDSRGDTFLMCPDCKWLRDETAGEISCSDH